MTSLPRHRYAPLFLVVLLGVLGGLLMLQRERIPDSFSLAREVPFVNLSKAVRGADGTFGVVFDSNKRIARVSPDGEILYRIPSRNDPEKGFFFANEIAFDPAGALYVASTFIDTSTLSVNREAVLRFSPEGRHEAVLFSLEHLPEAYTDNIGMIRSLQWTPEGLRFCILGEEGIRSLRLDPADGALLGEALTPSPVPLSGLIYATVSEDGGKVAFTTAATEIYTAEAGGEPVKRYDGRELPGEEFSIPSDIHYQGGELYFSDLGRDAILRWTGSNEAGPVFDEAMAGKLGYDDAFFECKSFQMTAGHLVLPNNGKVVHLRTEGEPSIRILDRARVTAELWIRRAVVWLLLALIAASALALLGLAVRHATPAGRRMAQQALIVAAMIGAVVGITTTMIFSNMNRRLEQESAKNLRGYLEVGRLVVDAGAVDRIRHVRHYMNGDYQAVLRQLQQTITRDGAIEPGTFSGVYKVVGGKVSALAYHDGLRGIFYPYDYQYEQSVYAEVAESGKPYVGETVDIYGTWLNGVIPLLNEAGETVGFLEVGVDQSAHREANRSLFRKTLIDLAMVLFVLLFIFTEIGFFSSHVLDPSVRNDADSPRYDEGALRFVSFLALSGVFLSASFLPLFSKSLAAPMGRLPFEMVIGLPMAIETLCGAVVALLYGHMRIRTGLKTDMVLGCLIIAGGMAGTAMANTFEHLVAARILTGMGMGLLMIAFRTYFLMETRAAHKESGIIALTAGVVAGINAGSVSGGMLAARFGMKTTFGVQAVLLVLAAAAAAGLIRNRYRSRAAEGSSGGGLSPLGFLFHRAVWSFFVFAFLPITTCGLFLGFLFPLFAESRGLSTAEISLAFMLFGVGSVYLGPSLTRLTTQLFGARRAVPAGALLMAGALLLFARMPTLAIAYVTVVIFGLTDSFVFNQGLSYFSSLPGVRRFGTDKAMGVYNVFESGGEALGPMVFGLAMSLGLGTGLAVIGSTLGLCALAFWAVGRPARKEST